MNAVLKSDPDVIMVGEIRDRETLQVSLAAALTGHMVLTTIHVREASGALKRMVDIFGDPFPVTEAVKLVLTQLLVRKLCPDCSEASVPSPGEMSRMAKWLAKAGSTGILIGTLLREISGKRSDAINALKRAIAGAMLSPRC